MTIRHIYHSTLPYAGVVFTLARNDARYRDMAHWAADLMQGKADVLGAIPLSAIVAAAAAGKRSVTLFDPEHAVSLAYTAVARRLMER